MSDNIELVLSQPDAEHLMAVLNEEIALYSGCDICEGIIQTIAKQIEENKKKHGYFIEIPLTDEDRENGVTRHREWVNPEEDNVRGQMPDMRCGHHS